MEKRVRALHPLVIFKVDTRSGADLEDRPTCRRENAPLDFAYGRGGIFELLQLPVLPTN